MKAKFLSLKAQDLIKSLLIFFLTTLVTGVYQLIQDNGELNWVNIKVVLISSIGATIAYLTKNFLTNSEGKFLTKEVKLE
jgi:hypothetical protein